jgi:hypothetical protein
MFVSFPLHLPRQSNFFAALDDSDNEGKKNAPVVTKKAAPKKEVVEPSKVENRP